MTIRRTFGKVVSALDNAITINARLYSAHYAVKEDEETGKKEIIPLLVRLEGTHGNKWQVKRALAKAFKQRRRVDVGESFVMPKAYLLGSGFGGRIPVDYKVKRISENSVEVVGQTRTTYNYAIDHFLVSTTTDELLKLPNGGGHVVYRGVIF